MKCYIDKACNEKNDSFAREILLTRIIEGRFNKHEIKKISEAIKFDLSENFLCVAVIYVEQNSYCLNNWFLDSDINEIIEDGLKNYCNLSIIPYLNRFIVVGYFNNIENSGKFKYGLSELSKVLKLRFRIDISIGIGSIVQNLENIKQSYDEATILSQYRCMLGWGKVFTLENTKIDVSKTIEFEEIDGVRLESSIKTKSRENVIKVVDKLFEKIELGDITFSQYKIYVIEIINVLLKTIKDKKIRIEDVFGDNVILYEEIENLDSAINIKKWIVSKALLISSLIKEKRVKTTSLLVEEAKCHISLYYGQSSISVEKVSRELHVSSTYLSTIFKKEVNMSFIAYVTKLRLEKAIELLETTDYKSYIVAKKLDILIRIILVMCLKKNMEFLHLSIEMNVKLI